MTGPCLEDARPQPSADNHPYLGVPGWYVYHLVYTTNLGMYYNPPDHCITGFVSITVFIFIELY
jgi:hypothetical protein